MGRFNGLGQDADDPGGFILPEGAACESLRQCFPIQERHHIIGLVIHGAGIKHLDDIGM